MNTHESYVSLETSKLLKQVGFDWECNHYYFTQNGKTEVKSDFRYPAQNYNAPMATMDSKSFEFEVCSRPTLEVAQRWLREVKNIFIEVMRYETINPLARELFEAVYDKTIDKSFAYVVNVLDVNNESIYDEDCFLTYEEAQEAGINKCLTILLEEKK